MTEWIVLDQAHQALRNVVAGVPADGWQLPTPCSEWNVTQVLQHAAGDQIGYAAFLTGGPGPSEDPFAPSGTLSASAEEVAEAAMRASAEAWAGVAADAQEVSVPIPPNKLSAADGVRACAMDAAVHAWDIAVATGQPSPLTPELAREFLPVARKLVEPLRQWGAFGPVVEGEGGDEVAELLRYLGRQPVL